MSNATWPPVDARAFGAVRTVAQSTVITRDDYLVRMDATGGSWTATLPPAAECFDEAKGIGQIFELRKADPSVNPVTVVSQNEEPINGAPGTLAAQHDSLTLISYGSGWDVL